MVGEWGTYALTDLYSVSSGLSKPAKDFGEGHPFVSFKDVFYNFFLPDELSQLVRSNEKEQEKCSVRRGDVFLTRTSETMEDLGMSCVSRKDYPSATFNGFCKRLRPSTDLQVHPEYVGYYLRTPQFRNEMLAFSTMSTRASLNNDMIGRLQITLPPLPEQKAIAHVLGSLDDKIELNRRMNETLEGMAQALFKSWFVDFDPVIDNALAAGNPIPEPLAQRAETRRQASANGTANRETAQAFPASFRFTEELGWIPEGWEISTMEDFSIEVESGKRPKGGIDKSLNDGVPSIGAESLLSIGNFEYSKLKYVQKEFADKSTKGWVKNYDVGIYKDGANVGDPSRVSLFGNGFPFEDFMVNEHVFLLRSNVIGQPFLYSLFRTEGISQQLRVMGTSKAAQPGLNQKEVLSCKFVAPNNNQFDEFNRIIFPLIDKRLFFGKESQTLAKLRDVLLPKLISGELRIPQAEKMVEDAIA